MCVLICSSSACSWKAVSTYLLNEDICSRHWVSGDYSVACGTAVAKLLGSLQSKRWAGNEQVNIEMWNLRVDGYRESWEDLLDYMGTFFWVIFCAGLWRKSNRGKSTCEMSNVLGGPEGSEHRKSKDQTIWDCVLVKYLEFISKEDIEGLRQFKIWKDHSGCFGEKKRRNRERFTKPMTVDRTRGAWLWPGLEWW